MIVISLQILDYSSYIAKPHGMDVNTYIIKLQNKWNCILLSTAKYVIKQFN